MKIVEHPYLDGVLCRDDGAILVPTSYRHKAHWTFGTCDKDGYRVVGIHKRHYFVHRLICEAFHGLCPPDKCQVDHIDRCPSNNAANNLRWVTPSENNRNTGVHERSVTKYGVSQADDINAYHRARYANDPVARERQLAQNQAWRDSPEGREKVRAHERARIAKKKAQGLTYRKGPNGKWGWFPKINPTNQDKE